MKALLVALGLCWALPATAQTRVVVPEGSRVVVPPRGGAMPHATRARRAPTAAQGEPWRGASRTAGPGSFTEDEGFSMGGTGLAVPLAILPLAAAAALATTLPGGGGSASAPARTR